MADDDELKEAVARFQAAAEELGRLNYVPKDNANPSCSFCGRRKPEVEHLIAGAEAVVCEICIERLWQALKELRANGKAI